MFAPLAQAYWCEQNLTFTQDVDLRLYNDSWVILQSRNPEQKLQWLSEQFDGEDSLRPEHVLAYFDSLHDSDGGSLMSLLMGMEVESMRFARPIWFFTARNTLTLPKISRGDISAQKLAQYWRELCRSTIDFYVRSHQREFGSSQFIGEMGQLGTRLQNFQDQILNHLEPSLIQSRAH